MSMSDEVIHEDTSQIDAEWLAPMAYDFYKNPDGHVIHAVDKGEIAAAAERRKKSQYFKIYTLCRREVQISYRTQPHPPEKVIWQGVYGDDPDTGQRVYLDREVSERKPVMLTCERCKKWAEKMGYPTQSVPA